MKTNALKTDLSATPIISAVRNPRSSKTPKPFRLSPKSLSFGLLLISVILVITHLIAVYFENTLPGESKFRRVVVQYFHLGEEANFPTYFSALLLLFSSLISFCIYKIDQLENNKKNLRYWLALSLILGFLSADEAVQIHEHLMVVVHYFIPNLSYIFSSAWVIPYALIFLLIGFFFLRFVFSLPNKTRNLIIISALVFVSGALGLELAESFLYTAYGVKHFLFEFIIALQEFLEMAGLVIFIYALLNYISVHHKSLQFTIR